MFENLQTEEQRKEKQKNDPENANENIGAMARFAFRVKTVIECVSFQINASARTERPKIKNSNRYSGCYYSMGKGEIICLKAMRYFILSTARGRS